MSKDYTRESSADGSVSAYDYTIPARSGRKVVVVETKDGVEVRYDQDGIFHYGQKFSSREEFERVAYKR